MAQPYKFLRIGVTIFRVLAWLFLALNVLAGVSLLIIGGPPEPVLGVEVPSRVIGLLYFIGAAGNFFFLWLAANVLQLLLDIRSQLPGGAGSGAGASS